MAERLSEAQLAELKSRHPCDQVAARLGVTLRKRGRKMTGPCPICSADKGSKRATRFDCDAEGWACAVCQDGGDVIRLVQEALGLDFRGAVDWLGGARDVDPAEAERRAAEEARKRAARERTSAQYRERERGDVYGIWKAHKPLARSSAALYLERRHLTAAPFPALGALEQLGYFERIADPADPERTRNEVIHRGPALLAAITRPDGKFAGLHMTYLDLEQPNGKLKIVHPNSGEELPAKKVRGSKTGNRIVLAPCAAPRVLVIGEGIETVLSVWRAHCETGRPIEDTAFWSSVDLGNLGGRALETIAHPTLTTPKGRPVRVPGAIPDRDAPAIAIPDSVELVILLGDGDSEPLLTQCALARAADRFGRPGRRVLAAWAPAGKDFNDLAPDWSAIMQLVAAAAPPAAPQVTPAQPGAPHRAKRDGDPGAAGEGTRATRKRRGDTSTRVDDGDREKTGDPTRGNTGDSEGSADKNFSAAAAAPNTPAQAQKSEILAILDGTPIDPDRVPEGVIIECSQLDHSDTDNAKRLERYFGDDLTVLAQSGVKDAGGQYLAWTGTHWELDGGASGAHIIAQRVGELIKAEADVMAATPPEREAIEKAKAAKAELNGIDVADESEKALARRIELDALVKEGMKARGALNGRRAARRKHAVSSKNAGKIAAMLNVLSHRLRRPPDDFNADPMLVVTRSHTLRFHRDVADGKVVVQLEPAPAHDRSDLVTALIPLDYDPKATCPRWLANLERFQPDQASRRTVQQYSGLGLLGLPIQRLMFHYGTGANFKSVYLETLTRTLGGDFAIGLPAESIAGKKAEDRGPGAASPDLERVFGRRMLRVLELPEGQPLHPGTIKKLTGGEKWPVRTLFKGYYEFQPRAKTHMSGNALPHYDGADGGMKRRLIIVEWPVTIAEAEQRDFEEVVGELMAEAPGILNWLIAGALDYLEHGLVISPAIAALTAAQTEEMDPIGEFFKDCVERDPAPTPEGVPARQMYRAYRAWSEANAKRVRSENKFGRDMKKLCPRDDSGRVHVYRGVRLHDVPASEAEEEGARVAARRARAIEGGDDDAPIV